MIYRLIKQDPAWRIVPIGMGALILFSFLGRGIWHFFVPASPPSGTPDDVFLRAFMGAFLILPSWLTLYFLLWSFLTGIGASSVRATPFMMSLPVSRRQILVARVASLTALVWVFSCAACLVFELTGMLPSTPAWKLLWFPAAGTLGIVVLQCIPFNERICPIAPARLCWLGMVLSGLPVLVFDHPVFAVAYPVALLLCALAIFFAAWETAPPTFEWVQGRTLVEILSGSKGISLPGRSEWTPYVSLSPRTTATLDLEEEKKRPAWRVWLVTSGRFLPPYFWIHSVLLVGPCFLLFVGAPGPLAWNLCLVPLFQLIQSLGFDASSSWSATFRPMGWLATLPIHPRSLLRGVMAGVFTVGLAAYFVGVYGHRNFSLELRVTSAQSFTDRPYNPDCATLNVMPPLEFWQPVNGQAPAIRAPWGEVFQPMSFAVLGLKVFNPYAVGCGNSSRFFDWQFERATVSMYGRPIAYYRDGMLPHPLPQLRRQIVTATYFGAEILLLGIFLTCVSWWRLRRMPRWLVRLGSIALSLLIFENRNLFILLTDGVQSLSNDPLVRIVWALPDSVFAVLAISGITLMALYWVFDRVTRQLEFVGSTSSVMSGASIEVGR